MMPKCSAYYRYHQEVLRLHRYEGTENDGERVSGEKESAEPGLDLIDQVTIYPTSSEKAFSTNA